MSNCLDSDQDGPFVSPDLGPNCFQRLSAYFVAGKESVKASIAALAECFTLFSLSDSYKCSFIKEDNHVKPTLGKFT